MELVPDLAEDRQMKVAPDRVVKTAWVDVDACRLANRDRMDCCAIERAYRRHLQAGECQYWPPVLGHWDGPSFRIDDGRHDFLALLALGRTEVFVAWLEARKP